MIDYYLITDKGGRDNNEDYVAMSKHGDDYCFVLCDGLGGHDCGEVASENVATYITELFEKEGDSPDFIDRAMKGAQELLLKIQDESGMQNSIKTTAVVLIITTEQMKWAHIGDSRLYHIFASGKKYERTKDHSMIQLLVDMGEIKESQMRSHPDRNKILRVIGAEWGTKSYDKSAILETCGGHSFALMTDGFWEYVHEEEMLRLLEDTSSAKEWGEEMRKLVLERADMETTDNYSAVCVRVD